MLLAEYHGSNKAVFGALHTAGSWSQNTRRTRLFCEDPWAPGTCEKVAKVLKATPFHAGIENRPKAFPEALRESKTLGES